MEIVKVCKKHGELTAENIRKEGKQIRCVFCKLDKDRKYKANHRKELSEKNAGYKANNRQIVRDWCKQDRINNPEKYRRYEQNTIKKYGAAHLVTNDICSFFKITREEYDSLFEKSENLCVLCRKPETRKSRTPGNICRLAVDHCHCCWDKNIKGMPAIRGILCHACNLALGSFKDDVNLMRRAIEYLEKHKCS